MPNETTETGPLQRAIDFLTDADVHIPAAERRHVLLASAAWHIRWNDRAAVREQENSIRHA